MRKAFWKGAAGPIVVLSLLAVAALGEARPVLFDNGFSYGHDHLVACLNNDGFEVTLSSPGDWTLHEMQGYGVVYVDRFTPNIDQNLLIQYFESGGNVFLQLAGNYNEDWAAFGQFLARYGFGLQSENPDACREVRILNWNEYILYAENHSAITWSGTPGAIRPIGFIDSEGQVLVLTMDDGTGPLGRLVIMGEEMLRDEDQYIYCDRPPVAGRSEPESWDRYMGVGLPAGRLGECAFALECFTWLADGHPLANETMSWAQVKQLYR